LAQITKLLNKSVLDPMVMWLKLFKSHQAKK